MRKACVIYVTATADQFGPTKSLLEKEGYEVCGHQTNARDAKAAKKGGTDLPKDLVNCIVSADLCVFLLPDTIDSDGFLAGAADLAVKKEKRTVGIVSGDRSAYPDPLEDFANSMVRTGSVRLPDAVRGKEIWESPDGSLVKERKIKNIRCQ